MPRRTRAGDVLEVTASSGRIYVHYLGRHSEYGDAIAVCTTVYDVVPEIAPELFRDSYVVFYPAAAAVARGLAAIVGHLPSSGVPTRLRRPGARSASGTILTWVLEDQMSEVVKQRLSTAEALLPLAVIWNHAMLIQRVEEKWRPEGDASHE